MRKDLKDKLVKAGKVIICVSGLVLFVYPPEGFSMPEKTETVKVIETPKPTPAYRIYPKYAPTVPVEQVVNIEEEVEEVTEEVDLDIAFSTSEEGIKIYKEPEKSKDYLGKLYKGNVASILSVNDGWVKIKSGDIKGYVKGDNLLMGETALGYADYFGTYYANIVKDNDCKLKVFKQASRDSKIIDRVATDKQYKILGNAGEWVQVQIDDSEVGYVNADFVIPELVFTEAISKEEEKEIIKEQEKLEKEYKKQYAEDLGLNADISEFVSRNESRNFPTTPEETYPTQTSTETANVYATSNNNELPPVTAYSGDVSGGSALQQEIASYALQFVGNPYVWGGESLTNGCDCSGFVMKIYEKYGVKLPHFAASQANYGKKVSLDALEPGDLVFYWHGNMIGHVAMYIGNGNIVHAKSTKDGIVTNSVNYSTPYSAVRLVNK
ncbi:MAG: C40 family peptidase [Lachnospiraceae bacterium]|nr:C40 family peptidase [Lachnospiraceae bacterium]